MDYAYDSSLHSNELRLLQPLSFNSQILRFRLLHVQRTSKILYTAVSYTWGDKDVSEVIYLDNRRFRVRPNLWSCLYYLSQAVRYSAWNYLWVDAICINQADIAERSSQVRLMDQTYRDAVCVSAWLGLVTLPEHVRDIPPQLLPIKTLEASNFNFADSTIDLAQRPYWSRVWVIQEFLLGRDVEIYCSDTRINWMSFQDMLCHEAGIEQYHDWNDELSLTHELPALSLVLGRHPDKHPEYLQPLCDLIIDHRNAQCKDPRDKVFGLLGLVTTEERDYLGRCFPDYAMSVDHVRIITVAHLTQFSELSRMSRKGKEINADSEEVFTGLGVSTKAERRRLLRRAERLDYIGDLSARGMMEILKEDDLMEEYEGSDADEHGESEVYESSRSCNKRWLKRSIGVMSTILAVWLIVRSSKT